MLVICCLTRVINGKIIADEAIYNFWRFLVEDFFLPVIKPPGTYFNNKLLLSCRSSKFSSFFPATSQTGSFENEALENEDRSTKHPNLENEAP